MKSLTNVTTFILPAALLLASCGSEDAERVDDGEAEASGEVLEGTISDEMLPLDEVRSQAPLAEADPEESGSTGTSEPATGSEPATQPDAEPIADTPDEGDAAE